MAKELENFLEQYNNFKEREYNDKPTPLEKLKQKKILPILYTDGFGEKGDYEIQADYNIETEEERVTVTSYSLVAIRREHIPLEIQTENFEKASYDDFIASYHMNYDALDELERLAMKKEWKELLEKMDELPYEITFDSDNIEKNLALERKGGKYQDREEFFELIQKDGNALWLGSETLRSDKEIVLTAVQQAGPVLEDASESLRDDKEVVFAAVRNDGFALNFASERLQNDKEVVLEALKTFNGAYLYASERLQNDKEVILDAVEKNGYLLQHMSEEFKRDKEVVLAAVKDPPALGSAFRFADESLKKDKEFVLQVLKVDPSAFREIEESLQKDKTVLSSLEEKKSKIPKKTKEKEGKER